MPTQEHEYLIERCPTHAGHGKRPPRSAVIRAWLAEGKAEGKAEGEAKAVLLILEARGISLPDEARARILACTDLHTLESWVRKAATAKSADDLFL